MLTVEQVNAVLRYEPSTGLFRWKSGGRTGGVAGNRGSGEYATLRVGGKSWFAHRVAWLVVYGEWPDNPIDHINGVKDDNRIANLRLCTPQQNLWNAKLYTRNKYGHKGVRREPSGRYSACIQTEGRKNVRLGLFDTLTEAASAYERAAAEMRGEFARTM